ncbi:hypothetical protein JRQ81_008828 [Phrynocephalus forsythii]|uniref:Rho-GAP domain-containing protein n=1 Tax=Phrynocephalus forsythii TaxID=171643 RepID=A0A9Q0XB90_9SAUR|nr:hypothetical protein JRQ81_008828 [Phrynocephalus forsythii]
MSSGAAPARCLRGLRRRQPAGPPALRRPRRRRRGGTLKRPTSLSRHTSGASGFPLSPAVPRSLAKGPKPPLAYSPPVESAEGGGLAEPEDIAQLLAEVAVFAERLEKLKDVVLQEDGAESRRSVAHECLGESLRTLRQIFGHYPLLKTLETLTAAGTLISRVKGFHYESNHEAEKREFEKAVEMIAVSFSSTTDHVLSGQSMENLYGGMGGQASEEASGGTQDFSSVEQDNKMTPGNLGIVFGPTLMRPRPTEATISLSSLVDYPHQARIVEALITFYPALFERPARPLGEGTDEEGPRLHGEAPRLAGTAESADAALQDATYGGPSAHFVDSDSDLEDGRETDGAPAAALPRGSQSSGEEGSPSGDDGSEGGAVGGTRSSLGRSDSLEDVSPVRCPLSPQDIGSAVSEDSVFGPEGDLEGGGGGEDAGGELADANTNQS